MHTHLLPGARLPQDALFILSKGNQLSSAEMATTTAQVPSDRSGSDSPSDNKEPVAHVEQVHTNEKVPGHPGYYEKDGLRTYGDDEDHDHEPPVRTSL